MSRSCEDHRSPNRRWSESVPQRERLGRDFRLGQRVDPAGGIRERRCRRRRRAGDARRPFPVLPSRDRAQPYPARCRGTLSVTLCLVLALDRFPCAQRFLLGHRIQRAALAGVAVVLAACADPPVPTSVTITPSSVVIEERVGQRRLTASVRDQYGDPLPGVRVTWSSSAQDVAAVDGDGTVRAVSNGGTTITAQATAAPDGGVGPSTTARGTASVTVDFPVLSRIRLSRTSLILRAYGAREEIVAEGLDQHGRPMSAVEFDWSANSTSTPDSATVIELWRREDARSGHAQVVAYRNGTASVAVLGTYVEAGARVVGESAGAAASVEVAYPIRMAIGPATINQAVQRSSGDIPIVNGRSWPLVRFPVYGYPAAVENEAEMPPWNHPLPPKMRIRVRDRHGTRIAQEVDIPASSRFLRWYQDRPVERIGGLETTANWKPLGIVWWTSKPVAGFSEDVRVYGEIIPPADWLVDPTSDLASETRVEVLPSKYSPITLVPVLQSQRLDLDHSIEWVRDFGKPELYPTQVLLGMADMDPRNPEHVDRRTETYTTSADLTQRNGWSQLLNEMLVKWIAEWGRRGPLMYGVLESPGGSGLGGVAYTGGVVGIGYTGRIGSVTRVNAGANTMAHEIGHIKGLLHAPCGNNVDHLDPSYPYPGGVIGYSGDLVGWGGSYVRAGRGYRVSLDLKSPAAHRDFMSYCGPEWVSDYHYLKALEHLHGPRVRRDLAASPPPREYPRAIRSRLSRAGLATSSLAEYRPDRTGQVLLLWGATGPDGLLLEPSFVMRGPASVPEGGGPYRLQGLDAASEALFSFDFTPYEMEHGGASFAFLIPYQPLWEGRLERIVLSGPEGEVALSHGTEPQAALVTDPATGRVRAILRDWDGRRGFGDAMRYSFSDGLPVGTGPGGMR